MRSTTHCKERIHLRKAAIASGVKTVPKCAGKIYAFFILEKSKKIDFFVSTFSVFFRNYQNKYMFLKEIFKKTKTFAQRKNLFAQKINNLIFFSKKISKKNKERIHLRKAAIASGVKTVPKCAGKMYAFFI